MAMKIFSKKQRYFLTLVSILSTGIMFAKVAIN